MKKDDLFQSLTYVVLVLYANYLILSSHLSVTSKVILLTLFSFVYSSAALQVILEWLDTLNTTKRQGGLNRLASLAAAEKRIAARGKTTTSKCQCPECDWKSPYGGHH
ncbi:gp4.2 protein [Escherichia phage K1F]|uniref:Gp4.2 protein n=1 Tax=Escherichia phage K1F TaxID=344021 RepID=Q2WC93_BPK1F|nr:gp4.2 protein [Escherichia phage K1F]CAJ29367.1 gp4.2 protein [Escherichia phage K1F]